MGNGALYLQEDVSKLLLRIATAGLMLFHGIYKVVHGHNFIRSVLDAQGLPTELWYTVPIAEILAPLLLLIGFLSRISAFLIMVVMTSSMYLAFGMDSFSLTETGGLRAELNIYFLLVSAALVLSGPGRIALYQGHNKWLR